MDSLLEREVIYDSKTPERQVRYREKNKDLVRERVRRSRSKRPKNEIREYDRELNQRLRVQTIMFLGGKCSRCEIDDMRVLQIDHINGGGTKENKKIHARGISMRAMKSPSEYQLLCANCNWIKRWERNENKPRKSD